VGMVVDDARAGAGRKFMKGRTHPGGSHGLRAAESHIGGYRSENRQATKANGPEVA